jgi:hypothetical protein
VRSTSAFQAVVECSVDVHDANDETMAGTLMETISRMLDLTPPACVAGVKALPKAV